VENQTNFHLQKNVSDFDPPIKSYGQSLERGWKRDIFFDIFKYSHWILSMTFLGRLKITNGFLEMEIIKVFQLFLVQNSLKKVIYYDYDNVVLL